MKMEAYDLRESISEKILDLANIGLWKWNVKSGKIIWSTSFKRIFGVKSKKQYGKFEKLVKKIYSQDRDRVLTKLRKKLENDKEFYLVFRVQLADKSIHWLSTHGIIIRNSEKSAVEVRGVCIDITRSKGLEKELKRTINQLRAVFSSVKVGITVEVESGFVVYSNAEMAKILFRKNAEEVNNHSIWEILRTFIIKNEDGVIFKPWQLPASEVFAGKKKVSRIFSFENKKTGVVRWFKITATAVDSDNLPTEMVVKVFQDITKEYEQQQNTLTSLGVASHELKNALASVKAYIQLVKRRLAKDDFETAKSYAETLDTQSSRLIKLINDLLDVSRIQSGFLRLNKKSFNYSELLLELVVDFKHSHPDYKFVTKIDSDLLIWADQERIVQVLLNLLSNSIKYSEKGKNIVISAYIKGNYVVTEIKDKGIGIAKSEQKRVFDLFKRGSGEDILKTKGLGIGLYTSSEIVKEHNGNIHLKSTLGKGSTFFIEIPIK